MRKSVRMYRRIPLQGNCVRHVDWSLSTLRATESDLHSHVVSRYTHTYIYIHLAVKYTRAASIVSPSRSIVSFRSTRTQEDRRRFEGEVEIKGRYFGDSFICGKNAIVYNITHMKKKKKEYRCVGAAREMQLHIALIYIIHTGFCINYDLRR